MDEGFPRLLGDVGGTNARWAWQDQPGSAPQRIEVVRCQASPSLHASAAGYLERHGLGSAHSACIGIATPVTGDAVSMTNYPPWTFSIRELQASLGLRRCLVINDFTALALSLPALGGADLRAVGGGRAVAGAPIGLLGPGTGLGVSGLVALPGATGWQPLSGEGGHVTLPAGNAHEDAVLAVLRRRFGHVSAERALSGPGLVNLYEAVCAVAGVPARALQPSDVSDAALAGSDPQCTHAVQLFAGLLGSVAGNLALTLGALGGVYVGGGIVPRLGTAFDEALFRQRFEDKGRFAGYLSGIPTWVITAATPALVGAARALDTL